jgi:hypothetical protein
MTGPWHVVEKLDGASYRLEHCLRKGRFEKKHASMMSPYPLELVPFEPIDGPDNCFGQLNRPISKTPFVEAGIDGFKPLQPFKLPSHYADVPSNGFYWPSLSELNAELGEFPFLPGEQEQLLCLEDSMEETPLMYTGPPPTPPAPPLAPSRHLPSISTLTASIIKSNDKLFFISFGTPPHLRIANGASSAYHLTIPFPSIQRACKMVASSLSSLSLTATMCAMTQSTSVIGFSIIPSKTSTLQHLHPSRTSYVHLTLPSSTPNAKASSRFANG